MGAMNIKRRLALAYYRATGYFPVDIGGSALRVVPEDRKFWRAAASGQWERDTFEFLERALRPDSIYVDLGAWIGPTVLFAAARCKTVYCVEPDAVAYERLLANLRMNDISNVRTFHGAIGSQNGRARLTNPADFGNSETRARLVVGDAEATAATAQGTALAMDLPGFIQWWGIKKIDLLKIDIEGGEFDLTSSLIEMLIELPAATKPSIHLSLHAPLFPSAERHAKLAAIVSVAEHYTHCYDQRLNKIPIRAILEEPFVGKFKAVVLSNTDWR